jgi:aspartate-semialdehyde dehydrogenase
MSLAPLLNVGVVGATGMVGTEFIKIILERKFPVGELRLFASDASKGQKIKFRDQNITVQTLEEDCFKGLQVVFFSSGDDISKIWAPHAVAVGATAIDNSGAFRMNPEVLLVVPEVNGHLLPKKNEPTLIANPNCSTIQLVVALAPLHKTFGITDVRVSSYQSVSGAGKAGLDELTSQTLSVLNHQTVQPSLFPHKIAFTNLPQIGSFDELGFCTEEKKIMNETQKIMGHPDLKISAFTVRTPTLNGHSEAVWVTLKKAVARQDVVQCLKKAPGISVLDDASNNIYPLNSTASGQDPVFVGRIHQDPNDPKTWLMWVVSDNIRKGAALNGIQIAEQIFGSPSN